MSDEATASVDEITLLIEEKDTAFDAGLDDLQSYLDSEQTEFSEEERDIWSGKVTSLIGMQKDLIILHRQLYIAQIQALEED